MTHYSDLPRMPRRYNLLWLVLGIAIVLLIAFPVVAHWATDFFWYREVGRVDVYWTMFWGRWVLGILIGAGFFAVVFANVYFALRTTSDSLWHSLNVSLRERAIELLDRTLRRVVFWGSAAFILFFAFGVGCAAADYWPQFLLFFNAQMLGTSDPVFQRDIGFYLFRLPVWELIHRWIFTSLVLALVLTTVVYLSTRGIRSLRGTAVASRAAERHLAILLALVLITKAAGYFLGRYGILYSTSGLFVGAGYTDVHVILPGLWIMLALAVLGAVVVLLNIGRQSIKIPIAVVTGLVIASIGILGLYPSFIQRFRVTPNELAREKPYLEHHIAMTRQAYGLETIKSVSFNPSQRVTAEMLADSPATVNNVRLWDHRPLLQSYRQLQGLRTYYNIENVDIDRYMIDGQLRQVMIAAREMNVNQIPGQQSWVNRHLIYTHGYGVVVSPVNAFDPAKGEPIFFVKDIPPTSDTPALQVTRPEIYFGELDTDYVVVKTNQQEFDYPQGGDNVYTTYEGSAGVVLRNRLVRALLASRFGSLDLLISSYITPESRILFRRQILERAQAVAPFLVFDRDPYIVIGNDGHLYWIIDAYSRSIRYPYSEFSTLETANGQTMRANYLSNPVKVVISAYDGSTNLYVADEHEPFIRAWRSIFPALFSPLSEMPAGLDRHVRVPEGLFNTISSVFRRYHMTEPTIFYGQEDLWDIPQENTESADAALRALTNRMGAYYIIMSLPGQDESEYLLIRPYTPTEKRNMISWLCARNDTERLGEMLVYNFPKQSLVLGPEQIEARINQTPEISEAITLWGQAGSRVWRGNLMVIPIGDTIKYVQPLFLQARQSEIPELQRVIVADQQQVVMRRTLEDALSTLTGRPMPMAPAAGRGDTPSPVQLVPPVDPNDITAPMSTQQLEHARAALRHYERAQEAMKRGDWATYGKEIEEVERNLKALNE